jgi:hypothetical protein
MEGFELSHVTPGAVDVSFSTVVAAALTSATVVATNAPPVITATTPTVVMSVISRERRSGPGVAIGGSLSLFGPTSLTPDAE